MSRFHEGRRTMSSGGTAWDHVSSTPISSLEANVDWANVRNALLASLSQDAGACLDRHLHEEEFSAGATLWNAGEPIDRAYFPISGMISILVGSGNGHDIEVAAVGREGAAGIPSTADVGSPITRAVTQVRSRLISISAQAFTAALRQNEEVRHLAAVARHWLLLQAQQLAACNAIHAADARFCRWLLRASDATASDMVPITQETIGQLLGIRRTTVTLIAQQMQSAGLISYRRGHIAIRDRAALEAGACICYGTLSRAQRPSKLLRSAGPVDANSYSAAVLSGSV